VSQFLLPRSPKMEPYYSLISSEYVMTQEAAFLRVYPGIPKPETDEFGSKAACRVLYYPPDLHLPNDEDQLLPVANQENFVVVGMYNIIVMDEGFICGDNNLIIGCHNTIKGKNNIVLGSSNYYIHHDTSTHMANEGLVAISTQLKNFAYRVPTVVLEKFNFKRLAVSLRTCNRAEKYDFAEAVVHLKTFYRQIQETVMATTPAVSRRRPRPPAVYRSEPYRLRSDDNPTHPLPPVSPPALPAGTARIGGVILDWLNPLITNVHQYDDIMSAVDDYYDDVSAFFGVFKVLHETEQQQQPETREEDTQNAHVIRITVPSGAEHRLQNIGGFLMSYMVEQYQHQYPHHNVYSSDDDEGPPTEDMLPPRAASEPTATDDADKCIICETRAVSTELVPCGHHYSCVTCVHHPSMARTCALCRAPYQRIIPYIPKK